MPPDLAGADQSGYDSVPGLVVSLDDEGVLRLTIDKPDRRNALDDVVVAGLIAAVDAAGRDEAVRVIVLTGTGDDFCSGFDLVARNEPGGARPRVGSIQRRLPAQAHRLIPLLLQVQTPVVCVVRGWAAGIGLNLALAADVTVATTDARFWAPFVERGFTPDSGATWMLPRRIGDIRARDMLLLGRVVSGAEAADWGMIHAAVATAPSAELDGLAAEIVSRLAGGPTVALGLTKWLLHSGETTPLEGHLRDEGFAIELASRSEDFKEGLSAFREKRSPEFRGR